MGGKWTACNNAPSTGVWGHAPPPPPRKFFNFRYSENASDAFSGHSWLSTNMIEMTTFLMVIRHLTPTCTCIYSGPGHSLVDGSCMHTPTINQSTVDGWTFKPLIIKHQVHSDDRRSMVGHSNHQPLTIKQQAHSDDRQSMVGIQTTNPEEVGRK